MWLRRAVVAVLTLAVASTVAVATFVGTRCYAAVEAPRPTAEPSVIPGYARAEAFTFLTLPEWYIVYSTEEHARWIAAASPSDFPYLGAVAQYWRSYGAVCDATQGVYPFEMGYHVMLGVIGVSFTTEYGLKAIYENTIGRATVWLFGTDTPEDRFAVDVAREYGAFMHTTPWYQFAFASRLGRLWLDVPLWGAHVGRKWERRLALSAELGVKAVYGWVMRLGSQAAYGAEELLTFARMSRADEKAIAAVGGHVVPDRDDAPRVPRSTVVTLPRYEAFTGAALALIAGGGQFLDIAGNDELLVTVLAPSTLALADATGARLVSHEPLVTRPDTARVAMAVFVPRLHEFVERLGRTTLAVEHVYDY